MCCTSMKTIETFLKKKSAHSRFFHLLYVVQGCGYFITSTKTKILFGSNNNGACHAFNKIKPLRKLNLSFYSKLMVVVYNKNYMKGRWRHKLAAHALGII